jgi:hypothetical protein
MTPNARRRRGDLFYRRAKTTRNGSAGCAAGLKRYFDRGRRENQGPMQASP